MEKKKSKQKGMGLEDFMTKMKEFKSKCIK